MVKAATMRKVRSLLLQPRPKARPAADRCFRVALNQHLGDSRSGSKVTVYLKDRAFARRMGIKHIDVGAVLHEHGKRLPGKIAVSERAQKLMAQNGSSRCMRLR